MFRRLLIVCWLFFGLFATTALSAEACEEPKPDVSSDYPYKFPESILNLELIEQGFEDDPRMGFFATYRADEIYLDIFVYNYGIENIPDGISSDVLIKHYAETKKIIRQFGADHAASLIGETQTSFGPGQIPVLEAIHVLKFDDEPMLSFTFLTARYGDFIKVRLSLPRQQLSQSDEIVAAMKESLGDVFCE